jgi:CBS domain containing-hemolysin-like protein
VFDLWLGNLIRESGATAIASAIVGLSHLASLTVDHSIPVMDCLRMASLDLSGRWYSAADAIVMASFLRLNSVLTCLNLSGATFLIALFIHLIGNEIGVTGAKAVASAIAGHSRLVWINVYDSLRVTNSKRQGSRGLSLRPYNAADAAVMASRLGLESVLSFLELRGVLVAVRVDLVRISL